MDNPSQTIISLFKQYALATPTKYRTPLARALPAARLAEQEGCNTYLIAACLLHEVGYLLNTLPDFKRSAYLHPEKMAADWLSHYFPLDVCEPIRMQTAADRYLSQQYEIQIRQEKPMGSDEAEVFQQNPWFADAVSLCNYRKRAQQEAAKRVRSLNDYAQLLDNIAYNLH